MLNSDAAQQRYGPNTEGVEYRYPAALLPLTVEEISDIVKIAVKHKVPLYPISMGHNWGYGSAVPCTEGNVIVDLSGMKKVLEFDKKLGLATIQPGVSQGQLYEYLIKRKLPFCVPVTGAGPNASILGNALERGFGNMVGDIFSKVTSLEAVLPDGSLYRSALAEMGCVEADRAFKWGLGPYVDGIFTQGNFGIVTQMTFSLLPLPERIEEFIFEVNDDKDFEQMVLCVREVFRSLGSMVSMIRIVNPTRLSAMVGKNASFSAWTGSGRVFGRDLVVRAARGVVKDKLAQHVSSLRFFTRTGNSKDLQAGIMNSASIQPAETGLVEAYWKNLGNRKEGKLNPANDGCGIIWYAPIIPFKAKEARQYVEMVNKINPKFGIEPASSLVITSSHYFYGITPIHFNRADEGEVQNARACYEALFHEGERKGFLPYRVPSHAMHLIVDPDAPFWRLAGKFKKALDPDNILAPGRYNLTDLRNA